ncbi:MAG: hypothetical protein FJX89_03355 [Bacteroidetes bacterium]|nr:hypothetical protein [Bacteroidota bacterium]
MGQIGRQSIFSSALIYLGFAIGAVNILILFPRNFTTEQIGLTRILLDVSMVLATVCSLGSVSITLRFFPFYQSYVRGRGSDLPFLSLSLGILGCLLLWLGLPLLQPLIVRKFSARSPLFVEYFHLIYPLTICMVFFSIMEAHAWNWRKTVLSNAMKEFGFRMLTTGMILLFLLGIVGFDGFIGLYGWIYLPLVVILMVGVGAAGGLAMHPRPSYVTLRLKGRIASFGTYMLGAALLNIIARMNDTIILASQSQGGLADAAVFTIATYLVTVMDVPQRSLIAISTPHIAEAWKDRNMGRIQRLYHKTSLHLMLAGIGIFCLVLLNIRDASAWLGSGYEALVLLVVVNGLGKLADLSTGLNTQVLLLSKFWKVDFFTNLLLMALSIPLNYWLTKRYGVMGPAYGNLISLVVFNLARLLLIWRLFQMQPFTKGHIQILVLAAACLGACLIVPSTGWMGADIALRSGLFIAVFGALVLRLRISDDIQGLARSLYEKITRPKG